MRRRFLGSNKEILREKISSYVTALLGLVGYDDIDPLRSREHILISNIFEFAWSYGKKPRLTELICKCRPLPSTKLGAFPVDNSSRPKTVMDWR